MKILNFSSTSAALDALSYGTAEVGDVLVVESEQVVGVASYFHFSVTVKRGELSEFLIDQPTGPSEFLVLVTSIRAAVAEAVRLGYEVIPELAALSLAPQ